MTNQVMETLTFRDTSTRSVDFNNDGTRFNIKGFYMTKFTFFVTAVVFLILAGSVGYTVYNLTSCRTTKISEIDAINSSLLWNDLLLPTHIKPLYYRLVIKPAFELINETYTYEGTVWITFSSKINTTKVDLNVKDLTIIKASLLNNEIVPRNEKLKLPLDKETPKEPRLRIIPKIVQFLQNGEEGDEEYQTDFDMIATESYESTPALQEIKPEINETKAENATILPTIHILEVNDEKSLDYTVNDTTEKLTLYMDNEIKTNKEYILEIIFTGLIHHEYSSFYWTNYTDNKVLKTLMSTQLHPTLARGVFPCFDQPIFAAPFEITLVRKSDMQTVSNTNIKYSMNRHSDLIWDYYVPTPPLPPSSIFFMISDLYKQDIRVPTTNTSLTLWSREEIKDDILSQSSLINDIIHNFQKILDTDIFKAVQHINLVVLPEIFDDSHSCYGVIKLRESHLWQAKHVSTEEHNYSLKALSIQIARAFLSSAVRVNSLSDAWLPEVIFKYISQIVVNEVEPLSKIFADEFMDTTEIMELDEMTSIPSLNETFSNFFNIRYHSYDVLLNKGVALLHMYQNIFGEEIFLKVIGRYLNHSFYNENINIWNILNEDVLNYAETKNATVKNFIDSWIKHSGYPVVIATIQMEENNIKLAQKHFSRKFHLDYLWNIPISYTSYKSEIQWSGVVNNFMVEQKEINITATGNDEKFEWLIINDIRTGYYRVNYDLKAWSEILLVYENMRSELPDKTIAQLLDDAFKLALSGYIQIEIPLNMSRTLISEESIVVWKVALKNFEIIENIVANSPNYGLFENYMLSLLNPIFDGIDLSQSEATPKTFLESIIYSWSCHFGNKECISSSQKLASDLLERLSATDFILIDFQESILCTAMEHSDPILWEKLYETIHDENLVKKKNILLKCLGYTRKPWLLYRLFEKMINTSDFSMNDIRTVVSKINDLQSSRNVLRILKDNWISIYHKYGNYPTILTSFINVLNKLNHLDDLHQYKTFVRENSATMTSVSQILPVVEEKISLNIERKNKYLDEITAWLMMVKTL